MNRKELVNKIFLKTTRDMANLLIVAELETDELEQMYYRIYNIA